MDLLVLYIGLLKLWIAQFLINVEEVNRVFCKAAVFLGYMCSEVSVWLIVAVTIERTIVVLFPLKAPRICNAKYAKIGITSIIVLFTSLNFHFLWSVDLHYTYGNNTAVAECKAKENFKYLVEHVWPWVDAALYAFFPFVFIFVLNLTIIRNVISAKNARMMLRQHTFSAGRLGKQIHQRQGHREVSRRITWMLLAVSFTFLVTTLPMNIYIIYISVTETPREIEPLVKRKLIDTISEMLMYTNHSINFFLFCATGKKFRGQVRSMVCACNTSELFNRFSNLSNRSSGGSLRLFKLNSSKTDDAVEV
ncbi:growth hormone secretagogue receptor type 1-like [Mya arenaria]|uniref:growth hormone secretagogue receptor type 1-like n=1 Tax=Mya arenaria TaxID=6604 RepID=UPI0022E00D22|nr:growth hormone secretagogue receptor type 1-like [Mya arenaria]